MEIREAPIDGSAVDVHDADVHDADVTPVETTSVSAVTDAQQVITGAADAVIGSDLTDDEWQSYAGSFAGRLTANDLLDVVARSVRDSEGRADAVDLSILADVGPGPQVTTILSMINPDLCDGATQLQIVKLWERTAWWATASVWPAVTAFRRTVAAGLEATYPGSMSAGRPDPRAVSHPDELDMLDETSAAAEIGLVTGLTDQSALGRITTAEVFTGRLRRTGAAVARGQVSPWVARQLSDAVEFLSDEEAGAVESRVLPRLLAPFAAGDGSGCARSRRYTQRIIRSALIAVSPGASARRRRQAEASTRITVGPGENGMAYLTAYLPAAQAIALMTGCTAAAKARLSVQPGPSLDQARVDALVDAMGSWVDHLTDAHALTDVHGRPRVEVQVTVDLATLLGMADRPGELLGYGPIDPDLARLLAADATWRRLVLDPVTGHVLDYGRTRYAPPQALRDYLRAAYPQCTRPGCGRVAREHDHEPAWSDGGRTSARTMHGVCTRCHRLKTYRGWRVEIDADTGQIMWISPHGQATSQDPHRAALMDSQDSHPPGAHSPGSFPPSSHPPDSHPPDPLSREIARVEEAMRLWDQRQTASSVPF